jgi:hypothetical protein
MTIDGVWVGYRIYCHNSELQVITAQLLISTIHRLPQHLLSFFPACCIFSVCYLATASNSGSLHLPPLSLLLSSEYPATELLSIVSSTIASSLLSLPWRAQLNCQPSAELTHSPTISLHSTDLLTVLIITSRHGPHRKHHSSLAVYGPLSSCLFRGCCLAMVLHATMYKKN